MTESSEPAEYRGPEIPVQLGERLAAALDLNQRPETLGDWAEAMARLVERADIDVGPETLCTTDQSPHEAQFAGATQHYQCVQDAVIVPFLVEDVDAVDITTESPVSGDTIAITVTGTGIEVDPATAVMSFGVAADVSQSSDPDEPPALAYDKICPYGHAFPNRAEYETWSADVDAVTMEAPMEDALHLARAIAQATRG